MMIGVVLMSLIEIGMITISVDMVAEMAYRIIPVLRRKPQP